MKMRLYLWVRSELSNLVRRNIDKSYRISDFVIWVCVQDECISFAWLSDFYTLVNLV